MNRNQVIDVLKMVVAADRRTADSTDVDVWESVIGDLDFDRCRHAVVAQLREMPGVWIEPGHIRQRVKAAINDEVQRTKPELRKVVDRGKLDEPIRALAASKALPAFERPSQRGEHNALTVACPYCRALPQFPCRNDATGKSRRTPHPSRIELVQPTPHPRKQ